MLGVTKAGSLTALAAVVVTVAAAVLSSNLAPPGQALAQDASEPRLSIDADPTGNTATALDSREACVSVSKGDTFDVDVVVEGMTDLLAWEAYLSFNPDNVRITDRDVQFFTAATANGNAFDISESVPDNDAPYRVGAANITDSPEGSSGEGVLARLTMEAVGSGTSVLSVAPQETDAGTIGATLTDVNAEQISDSDDDGFFDGLIVDAQVAVDEPCPGSDAAGGNSSAIGGGGDEGGLAWWVFAAGAIGAVAVIGFGGAVLMARRRTGAG
jgi:hypothetical protein